MAIFAKYDGVDGESKDDHHDKWIDLRSIEWAVSTPGAVSGARPRRRAEVEVEAMVLTMEYDKAAPKLLEKSLKGQVTPKLEVELTSTYGGARAVYLRYELTNVRVSSYQVNAYDQGTPTVVVANNFEEIKVTYTEYADDGSSRGSVETEHKVPTAKAAARSAGKKKRKKK